MRQINCRSLSTSCDKRVLGLRNIGVSKCQRWTWPQFHILRTQTVHSSLQLSAVFHWCCRYGRDRSVEICHWCRAGLDRAAWNFFSQLSKQWLILSISVQMLCEWLGMNEFVDRMSIVYFRSDCGFHNYPYMVRGRTFLNSFSATIWRKWGQISPKTLVLNNYNIYWRLGVYLFDIFVQIA